MSSPEPAKPEGSTPLLTLALCLLIGVAFTALSTLWVSRAAEWLLFDQWQRWTAASRPLSEDIALVTIDDASLGAMTADTAHGAPKWPWPRQLYADLLTYLHAAGAKKVYVDLTYEEPSPDAYDDDVLAAFAEASDGRVLFGKRDGVDSLFEPTFPVTLAGNEGYAVRRDAVNGRLLGWPGTFNEALLPHAESASNLIFRGRDLREGRLGVDDMVEPDKVRAFLDSLAAQPPPEGAERYRGKTVFVGATAHGTYDAIATPVGYPEPGMVIHVVNASNAQTGGYFREAPWWQQALLIMGVCLAVGAAVPRLTRIRNQVLAGVALLAAVLPLSWALFLNQYWLPPVTALLGGGVALTAAIIVVYWREGRHKRWIIDTFGNFLSADVVARLIDHPELLRLGGTSQQATVLFSDLAGFTSLSEKMTPEQLVAALNDYLTEMSELVITHGGYLDKYIGDAIMALFGLDPRSNHAADACRAALACHRRLGELAPGIEARYGVRLAARLGINTGEMVVGMMGSARKRNYTAMGDAVNLSSRLEGANKPYDTAILVGEETHRQAGDGFAFRPVDNLAVKGKAEPVRVYELLAERGKLDADREKARGLVEQGFAHYLARRWTEASAAYREADALLGGDGLCRVFLDRLAAYEASPPPADWDGVFRLDTK